MTTRIRFCRTPSERIYQVFDAKRRCVGSWCERGKALALAAFDAHPGGEMIVADEYHGLGRDFGHVERHVVQTVVHDGRPRFAGARAWTSPPDDVLLFDDLCALLKIARSTLYVQIANGVFDFAEMEKLDRHRRWSRVRIVRWIESRRRSWVGQGASSCRDSSALRIVGAR